MKMSKFQLALWLVSIMILFPFVLFDSIESTVWMVSTALILPFVVLGLDGVYLRYKKNKK